MVSVLLAVFHLRRSNITMFELTNTSKKKYQPYIFVSQLKCTLSLLD